MNGFIHEHRSMIHGIPFFVEQLDSILAVKRFGYIGGATRANMNTLIEFVVDFGFTEPVPQKLYQVITDFMYKHIPNQIVKLYVDGGIKGINPACTRFEELQINMYANWIWSGRENHPLDSESECGAYAILKEWFIVNTADKIFGKVNIKDLNSLKKYLNDFDEMQQRYDYCVNAKSYRTTLNLDMKLSLY